MTLCHIWQWYLILLGPCIIFGVEQVDLVPYQVEYSISDQSNAIIRSGDPDCLSVSENVY